MSYKSGFFRITLSLSIIDAFILLIIILTHIGNSSSYDETSSNIGIFTMVFLPSIWLIYGLTKFVIKGFKKEEKNMKENNE
jgi:hypothetical protein